jgi:flavin-dependent dehydrogenase
MERVELAIVGGGPAGLSTALHLLETNPRLAERTLVLEAARYPRAKSCAGVIAGRGLQILERLGVPLAVRSVPVNGMLISVGAGQVRADEPEIARVVRREAFDHALAREAVRRGARLREGAYLTGLERREDGWRLHLRDGDPVEARALVGADGAASAVRRHAGFPPRWLLARAIEVETPRLASDPPADVIHFDFSDEALCGYAWDFPAVAGASRAGRGVYLLGRGRAETLRPALEEQLRRRGISAAGLRIRQASQRGFEPHAPLSLPRVLLVGEAAGIDSVTGEGIPQALAYGALAAEYLGECFGADDLGFASWLARVRRSELGRRLRMLHSSAQIFYGPRRAQMERIIAGAPSVLRLWVQGFAGRPRTPDARRLLAETAPLMARHGGVLLRALAALLLPE